MFHLDDPAMLLLAGFLGKFGDDTVPGPLRGL